ncbi:putative signal peptide protein [Puccinia sorghi]|uniref:Putative signal peptide protein n=1 Tax=Puccinia sorghi TaxID=27349 RepID=A0A0L6UPH6_9BASI|nr:putative signal peptide protein [Puccinia sorghi]
MQAFGYSGVSLGLTITLALQGKHQQSNLNSINEQLLLCKTFTQFSHCVMGRNPTLLSKQPSLNI